MNLKDIPRIEPGECFYSVPIKPDRKNYGFFEENAFFNRVTTLYFVL